MRIALLALYVLALAALGTWLVRTSLAGRVPDVEVRSIKRHHHSGRLLEAAPLAQGFVCASDGLFRIDVWVQPLTRPPEDDLALTLYDGELGGFVVRHAEAETSTLRPNGGFLGFEFEPLRHSAGRTYWFQLRSAQRGRPRSDCTVWIRERGAVEIDRPWGDRGIGETLYSGELRPETFGLSGMAFATLKLAGAPPKLRLWDAALPDAPIPDTIPPLVRAGATPLVPVEDGWTVFRFPALEGMRRHPLRYELEVGPGTELVATEDGPSFLTIFGPPMPSERLLGMSAGERAVTDRDLVFRAWATAGEADAWSRFRERAGQRGLLGLVVWSLGVLLLVLVALPRRARGEPASDPSP